MRDILSIPEPSLGKTMYEVGLSYTQAKAYFLFLVEAGLLERVYTGRGYRSYYRPTEKGRLLLGKILELFDMLPTFEFDR